MIYIICLRGYIWQNLVKNIPYLIVCRYGFSYVRHYLNNIRHRLNNV